MNLGNRQLRLNKLVAFVGVSVNNPWTIVPISTLCVWVGAKVLRVKEVFPAVDWKGVTFTKMLSWSKSLIADHEKFTALLSDLWPLLKSFFVGGLLVCTVSSIASYFIILKVVTKYQKSQHAA